MRYRSLTYVALIGAILSAGPARTADRQAQLEADWLLQERVRGISSSNITPAEDALGACDGVKDGKWGFHTNNEENPWWQVDLGRSHPLDRVLVYNRCDAAARADGLLLLLSPDGRAWREAGRHSGPTFFGASDGKPFVFSLGGARARYVRLQLPGVGYLHLDEVEVYSTAQPDVNLALWQRADQSSVSQWSVRHLRPGVEAALKLPVEEVVGRGRRLAVDLRAAGVEVRPYVAALEQIAAAAATARTPAARHALYLKARHTVCQLAFQNPLLDFDRLLFVKRVSGSYSHMSDQHYGWWSRPGGGLFILEGLKSDQPTVRCLTTALPEGSCSSPDLSYDGRKILFAYCRYYPHVAGLPNKVDKEKLPEDAFYHVYEVNVDGTGLRQLTHGRYDDFDPRYLPNGEILFLSTRRGQFVQYTQTDAAATMKATLPDCYVRCGGDPWRPVAVYTLHTMDANGERLRPLSPFENFEWTPAVANDGRILYARWDYVDRDNMPYMSLWATNPDGTNPQIIYGNFTHRPHCTFEARSVPGSRKILFTASAHHSITGGSLVLLDPDRGSDGPEPLTRLTPEVCFPEIEGWPASYYASPYPLSERYYLTAWSPVGLNSEGGTNPPNALGLYLYDAFGNLELLYRDPEISSLYPIPLRPRRKPPVIASSVAWEGRQEGRFLLLNVAHGMKGIAPGTVKRLRIIGVPAKTQPNMNTPVMGVTQDDPGKFILGTVPVEADGSAHFRVPSGVGVFFQALDERDRALRTMRSLTYVQPNQTLSCIGCHEPRNTTPANALPAAATRPPAKITLGPEGSWPLRFDRLVQPVLDRHCVGCHYAGGEPAAARFNLEPANAYASLIGYGSPSLRDHVLTRYREGHSPVSDGPARTSSLLALLEAGHYDVQLNAEDWERLISWMDTYGQVRGAFSDDQEARLVQLRHQLSDLLVK